MNFMNPPELLFQAIFAGVSWQILCIALVGFVNIAFLNPYNKIGSGKNLISLGLALAFLWLYYSAGGFSFIPDKYILSGLVNGGLLLLLCFGFLLGIICTMVAEDKVRKGQF